MMQILISVADLPGLIPDSHKNKGLGIQFLRHAERCMALVYVIDVSLSDPWTYLDTIQYELSQFNATMCNRPHLIAANKIDLPGAMENVELLKSKINSPIIPVCAQTGENVDRLLTEMKIIYDKYREAEEDKV